jgi:DNA-binding response OmpR family regulator
VTLSILYVEDDPDDAFFFSRAIKNAKPECELHLEKNGEGAIDYLGLAQAGGKSSAHGPPDLMILDLKLTGMSGFEVLSWTRDQAAFKTLPIIILSGSSLVEDKTKASKLGASAFIVKQTAYDQIAAEVVQFISKNGLCAPHAGRSLNAQSQSQGQ